MSCSGKLASSSFHYGGEGVQPVIELSNSHDEGSRFRPLWWVDHSRDVGQGHVRFDVSEDHIGEAPVVPVHRRVEAVVERGAEGRLGLQRRPVGPVDGAPVAIVAVVWERFQAGCPGCRC